MSDKITIVKGEGSYLPDKLAVIIDVSVPPHVFILRTENHEVIVDCKAGTLQKKRRVKFEPLPSYGTHMTWREFVNHAQCGMLNDDDGEAMLATATEVSNLSIGVMHTQNQYPEDENAPQLHDWATHVVWFNK